MTFLKGQFYPSKANTVGISPWNKGKELSNEYKKKLSLAHKGKKLSAEHKINIQLGRIEAGYHPSPNWKGGKTKNLVCRQCGIKFNTDRSNKKFCSNKCRALSLKGKYPINLKGKRGKKPRTYHLRKDVRRGGVNCKEWRDAIFKRDNYACVICGQKGGKLNADHIKSFAGYPELRFAIDNGRTLCVECHKKTDNFGWKNYHAKQRIINTQTDLFTC